MKQDTRWLYDQLANKRLSVRAAAKMLGFANHGNFVRRLNGTYEMSAQEMGDLARLIGQPVEAVMQHMGVKAKFGTVDHSPLANLEEFKVRAAGSPMNGWTLFYAPTQGVDATGLGQMCVGGTAGKRIAGVVVALKPHGFARFASLNVSGADETEQDVRLKWLARVKWINVCNK